MTSSTTPVDVRVDHLAGRTPDEHLLQDIKRTAKLLKKSRGLTHSQALDAAAEHAGFSNFQHGERACTARAAEPIGPKGFPYMLKRDKADMIQTVNNTLMLIAAASRMGHSYKGRMMTEEQITQGVLQLRPDASGKEVLAAMDYLKNPVEQAFGITREQFIRLVDNPLDEPPAPGKFTEQPSSNPH
ncbi:hypothetical protein ACYPKM_04410 [Pseudomonas aeruginosa]